MRRIAANYVFFPGHAPVHNGYAVLDGEEVRVVDTGGVVREMAGLEFYGGMLVPGYVAGFVSCFREGEDMVGVLETLFRRMGNVRPDRVALIEGADLRRLCWKAGARIRLL